MQPSRELTRQIETMASSNAFQSSRYPKSKSVYLWIIALLCCLPLIATAFSPVSVESTRGGLWSTAANGFCQSNLVRTAASKSGDVCTVQILMSDTGGGHRASANALSDAFDVLYPGKFECDIVDLYTDYGPIWPYNDYVALYKILAKYPLLWDIFYSFGETDLGLWLNEFLLDAFCFESFKECLARPSASTDKRANMVVSVHPLCQDIPLKILSELDSDGTSRSPSARETPFVTVVTDLGGAHKTWFNPK